MDVRIAGASGLRVSAVGLGCNNFGWTIGTAESRAVVHRALDLGVTLFDTADRYGKAHGDAEAVLGQLIEGERDRIVLTTKFGLPEQGGPPDNSRSFILSAIESSLRRLRTDRIDIYMIHWPDPRTAMEETLRALDDLVTSGKVRYIACSNLAPWRVVEAKWLARELGSHSFIAAQDQYSLLHREPEKELIPAIEAYKMALIPYFPLASGLLTGKYLDDAATGRLQQNLLKLGNHFLTERNLAVVRALDGYAKARGHSLLELAMNWLLARPVVASIIAGATSAEQVAQNVGAIGWTLPAEDLADVDKILSGT